MSDPDVIMASSSPVDAPESEGNRRTDPRGLEYYKFNQKTGRKGVFSYPSLGAEKGQTTALLREQRDIYIFKKKLKMLYLLTASYNWQTIP